MIGPKVTMVLERYTHTSDGMGGHTETWEDHKKVKGTLITLSGDERLGADKVTVYATHRFYINFPKWGTITEKDRFKFVTKQFQIKFISNTDGREVLQVLDLKEIA